MGSRVRDNPGKLYDVFVEIAKPEDGQDAFILQMYPPEYDDENVLKEIPKFVYPCEMESTIVDHFTFVLTDLESNFRFGFCRHATGAQTCLCIISVLPWYEVFYKQLNLLAEILNRTENNDLTPLLESMYNHEVPMPGVPVTVVAKQDMFNFNSPDSNQLPSIPASRNLTEYYNAMDTNNMMNIFASMLNERRIIFTSKKLSRLTSCIHGAESLLYPMHWQHLYIPVLPNHLKDYVTAPMPFVIGVHASMMNSVRRMEIGDAVIVDTDNNTVETEHEDLEDLPDDVASYLKKHLKGDRVTRSMQDTGDAIPKAFLNALVRLIGGYRDALKFRTGEEITFDPEAFVISRTESMQPFLENMLQLQIFQQFINGRLESLNCGDGFSDIFEKEAVLFADKMGADNKYKEWVNNMKKQGKKFQKTSKNVFSGVRHRAPIMMTSAVQSMKEHMKKASSEVKKASSDFKAKINEQKTSKGHRGTHKTPDRQRPATVIGSNIKAQRPPRPSQPPVRATKSERPSTQYRVIDSTQEDGLEYQRVSVNLMTDPDIQHACQRSASSEMLAGDPSDSSSSIGTPSSGAQTPAEMEDSGIPYVDLEANQQGTAVPTEFASLPRSSPVIWKNNNISVKPIDGPPIPAPRSRSMNVKSVASRPIRQKPKDEELIRFESVESDHETQFDPLAQNSTPQQASTSAVVDSSFEGTPDNFDRSRPQRRSLINRSPAFRQSARDIPKRSGYKPDHSPDPPRNDDPNLLFDPLAGFDKSMIPNTPEPKSQSTDPKSPTLLGDWSFSQLTSSPTINTPPQQQRLSMPHNKLPTQQQRFQSPSTSTNPAFNMSIPHRPPISPRPNIFPPSQNFPAPRTTNPLYVSQSVNSSAGKTSPAPANIKDDPFSDLCVLPGARRSPQPPVGNVAAKTKMWEKFD